MFDFFLFSDEHFLQSQVYGVWAVWNVGKMVGHIYWEQIMEVFDCYDKEFRVLFRRQSRTIMFLSQD